MQTTDAKSMEEDAAILLWVRCKNGRRHTMTETEIQNQIRVALSDYGIVVRMNTGNFELKDGRHIICGVKGLPDLLFVGRDGKTAFIEVKSDSGRASMDQLRLIGTLQDMGHTVGICRSVDDALRLIGSKP
jgi:hypothetical protein